jgi:GntR family transcriptional regulator, carbon starvation induced regulator
VTTARSLGDDAIRSEQDPLNAPPPYRHVGTLASFVYDSIRADILRGVFKPDEKLRVEHLCERYGTGATPIREALNRLSTDGFVKLRDRRGFRVAGVSEEDLRELTRTRCLVEGLCLKESVAHGDRAWESEIAAALARLSLKLPAAELQHGFDPVWEEHHRQFHIALISACGSSTLIGFCQLLFDRADRYRLTAAKINPDRNIQSEHEAIAEAALTRRADLAVRRLREHYLRTQDIVLHQLRNKA